MFRVNYFSNKLIFIFVISIINLVNASEAQVCAGSWSLQRPVTLQCVVGQWIGWQNVNDPLGCPVNPIYTGVQTNTFTFNNPVIAFAIDFKGLDTSPGCARIEIKINEVFYPLTVLNISDFPVGSTCITGSFSYITVTNDGYITASPAGGISFSGQGRIMINNVNASSVTLSTNDVSGTVFSNPFNCVSVVPLKLESFTGISIDCRDLLNWKTGTESNIKNIEVQKSKDGIIFNKAGEVSAKGSNSQYAFITDNLKDGYFRLKINDLDGSYEYSETLYIRSACKNSYTAVPNPANDYVQIAGLKNTDVVSVNDMVGKIVLLFNAPQTNKLNIQSLPSGMYIFQISNAGIRKATLKVIKH
jgi:hypothetical protein